MDPSRLDIRPSPHPIRIPGSAVPVLFGSGCIDLVGEQVLAMGRSRVLLVTDPGIRAAGHAERAVRSLYRVRARAADTHDARHGRGIVVRIFDDVHENPTTEHVEQALRLARQFNPDIIIGLGGGSSLDTAKGVNFLYTNGGRMQDYWGTDKAARPMLLMIAIPTTAGTGSEAQSYALISDAQTHVKMACGDRKALPALAVLDPDLTATQPRNVAAATGIDAIAHAVETAGCTRRTAQSLRLSAEAWRLLSGSFAAALHDPQDASARQNMLLGAHLAGCAIENSMLGAAHATANPLTARYGITHGVAVGLMLPHVVRFNGAGGMQPYSELLPDAEELAERLEQFLDTAQLPRRLRQLQIDRDALGELAEQAARQWTATFNPRKVGIDELLAIYESAW